MAKCLPCSGVKLNEKGIIKKLKKEYEDGISDNYVYRLKAGGDIFIVPKSSFNVIFKTKIKPSFKDGGEYFHISEFTFD